MYECCHTSNHLVGGAYTTDTERTGLWCWTMNNTSSNVYISNGARLIILRYSLWDLMCFVLVFFLFAYTFALVGGRYDNGLPAGLWYWNCWENSGSANATIGARLIIFCLLYTSPSPRDRQKSRMPSSA